MALPFFNRNGNAKEMSFIDHLEELRWHIIRSVIVIFIAACVIWFTMNWFFDTIILGPIRKDFFTFTALCRFSHWAHLGDTLCMPTVDITMQTTSFGSQFVSSITLGLIGGFIIAFPYVFWEFWKFVKPALTHKELKHTRGAIFWVSLFFFSGAAFGYYFLAPFTFSFLGNFKLGAMGALVTRPTLDDYIDNLSTITLGTGLAFQLPVVAYVLTYIGIISPKLLKTYRKYAIVGMLVLAAVITPSPDWISQMIVFTPLFLLYQLSVIVSKRVYNRKKQREIDEWGEPL